MDDRSLNGVFLNGDRVEWGTLTDGDELVVGRHHLYFLDTLERSEEGIEPSTDAAA